MNYTDPIYGPQEINDKIILDLINSKALQRLKGIDQAGYHDPFFPGSSYTRYEHSIGVYLLLKKYGAPLEEQISGLIHDISHLTFSHCIDYVFEDEKGKTQSHQDDIFGDFVMKTDIPKILKKHKIDINYVLDDNNFPLKEKNLPDLCADRIDYSLRTLFHYHKSKNGGDKELIDRILAHLKAIGGNWVFDDFESAWDYAEVFRQLNSKYYAGIESAVMHRAVGDCLRYALSKNFIAKEDFHEIDSVVLGKIVSHLDDANLRKLFARMNNKTKYVNDPKSYESVVYCKSRLVDPLFEEMGKIYRFSDKYHPWKEILKEESKPKEYYLKFLD